MPPFHIITCIITAQVTTKIFKLIYLANSLKMRLQVYLFIFGLIGGYLDSVLCDRESDKPDDKMKMIEDDIMDIAPSLLRFPPGRNSPSSWPGNIIPYEFQRGYPQYLRRLFRRAAHYIAQSTCIKFVPRNGQRDYVHVIAKAGACFSIEGRMGGPQQMSLPRGCPANIDLPLVVHEMLHAVGYPHEQNRFDRDDYVIIQPQNIERGFLRQFEKNRVPLRSQYDYDSVMHYGRKFFSFNGRDTIVPRRPGVRIGQAKGMSRGDLAEINADFCS